MSKRDLRAQDGKVRMRRDNTKKYVTNISDNMSVINTPIKKISKKYFQLLFI
jgi:hypothetical protein